ncbi:MAG: protein translocase subunit SecD [Alphaproteobacteria bacterium]|nr:protein translocase subunit SecD [Alphaproteobacteria bacterium]
MVYIARWKAIAIVVVCVLGLLYAAPNMMSRDARLWMQENLPSWMPTQSVNLGLDLQGGSHLLLEVDVASVFRERSQGLVDSVRPELRESRIGYTRITALPQGGMRLTLREPVKAEEARKIIRGVQEGLEISVSGNGVVEAIFSEALRKEITDQTISQSIEIVRRRVDETGTREPVIQRQGEDRILIQLPGLDDPQRIKDLLGKTAKLTFHLVDQSGLSEGRPSAGSKVYPMAEDPARTISVERRALLSGDMLTSASFCTGQYGDSAVCFRFNNIGARRFCDITRENVNKPFAIVLDDEVITAPNINEPICGGSGQITGNFTVQEANDLALLLRAGALPAPLNVLEERTVGPSLGEDSVEAGKNASLLGFALVMVFMALAYGRFGLMADVALILNVALIFAVLSGLQATLTLPGIAGIVLTIGMAVDANVLIFERIREELAAGRSPISAVDSGYRQVMSTIMDANLTTLIATAILYSFGTGPIKGFAVTLSIGVLTSMFSAIMVTRLILVTWLHHKKPSTLNI